MRDEVINGIDKGIKDYKAYRELTKYNEKIIYYDALILKMQQIKECVNVRFVDLTDRKLKKELKLYLDGELFEVSVGANKIKNDDTLVKNQEDKGKCVAIDYVLSLLK